LLWNPSMSQYVVPWVATPNTCPLGLYSLYCSRDRSSNLRRGQPWQYDPLRMRRCYQPIHNEQPLRRVYKIQILAHRASPVAARVYVSCKEIMEVASRQKVLLVRLPLLVQNTPARITVTWPAWANLRVVNAYCFSLYLLNSGIK
jgi:hypothetical protein